MTDKKGANRRKADRVVAVHPVQIDATDSEENLGITRDLSTVGTLMFTRTEYKVGERLQVAFYPPGADAPERAAGKVVRVQKLEAGFPWRYATAISFENELAGTILFERRRVDE